MYWGFSEEPGVKSIAKIVKKKDDDKKKEVRRDKDGKKIKEKERVIDIKQGDKKEDLYVHLWAVLLR
jgi:hypothetical protein